MRHFIILFFFLVSSVALGQKHLIGIQGGVNLTNFSSNESFENTTFRTGWIGGLTYDWLLNDKYRFGLDILYAQRGIKDKFYLMDDNGVYTGEIKTEMNYDYLSFPLKFGYVFGNRVRLIPKIGIVPALVMKAEITVPGFDDNGMITGWETVDHKDYVTQFDLGGIGELGIETDLSERLILCSSFSYKHSFTTFSNSGYFDGYQLRHYGFSIALGIKYRLPQ
ncbi:outer membrane beta-barrel protein [uncultured Sunxiuqinia sp.]|uniref:outer membrane beta-barrel protein n=1 Tax=uncultured Sunxiuqinia sp. TaxID=1573825 RepID=UPI00261EE570|nr:outer membrane beta-barrel protein [uncultured Sunxiuqinia sp.]